MIWKFRVGIIDTIPDSIDLQTKLTLILEWCFLNTLSLNISKCTISYTRSSTVTQFPCAINGDLITKKDKIYDLGVLFDSHLTSSGHISTVYLSTSKFLEIVIRLCRNFNKILAIKILYYALVLEYWSLLWYSHYIRISATRNWKGTKRVFAI